MLLRVCPQTLLYLAVGGVVGWNVHHLSDRGNPDGLSPVSAQPPPALGGAPLSVSAVAGASGGGSRDAIHQSRVTTSESPAPPAAGPPNALVSKAAPEWASASAKTLWSSYCKSQNQLVHRITEGAYIRDRGHVEERGQEGVERLPRGRSLAMHHVLAAGRGCGHFQHVLPGHSGWHLSRVWGARRPAGLTRTPCFWNRR
jgi:hypothetical protein